MSAIDDFLDKLDEYLAANAEREALHNLMRDQLSGLNSAELDDVWAIRRDALHCALRAAVQSTPATTMLESVQRRMDRRGGGNAARGS
jgi:hypothetical protein